MTKKINSTGKNLTLTNFWNLTFQNFGVLNFLLNKYFHFFILFNYLFWKLLLFKNQVIVHSFKIMVTSSVIYFVCLVSSINVKWLQMLNWFLYLIWKKNFFYLPLHFVLYLTKNFYFSNCFLKDYVLYLTKICLSLKKIFNLLVLYLTKNLFHLSLFWTKQGFVIKQFVGFKLKLVGRYEVSKTAMAKKSIIKIGNVNSTNLRININFSNYFFYTKLGISNLKIWAFYKKLN